MPLVVGEPVAHATLRTFHFEPGWESGRIVELHARSGSVMMHDKRGDLIICTFRDKLQHLGCDVIQPLAGAEVR